MRRPALAIAALGLLGLLAAAGIGLLVNEVSGDSIGLAAKPLSAGPLAPPEAQEDDHGRDRNGNRGRDHREDEGAAEQPAASTDDDVVEEPPELEPGDDNGGDSVDSSGSGSSGSGSGSDDNSGSGSSSSGSGSGDDD